MSRAAGLPPGGAAAEASRTPAAAAACPAPRAATRPTSRPPRMAHTPRASPPVGSGAVGVGCQRLRLCTRPDNLAQKQALAAVGQVHLMRYYDDLFTALDLVGCGRLLVVLVALLQPAWLVATPR